MASGPSPGIAPPCSKHTGKIAGIYLLLPLNDLANLKATGLSQTAYDFTLVCHSVDLVFASSPSPGLLSAWRPRVLSKHLGSLQLPPSARCNLPRCFFFTFPPSHLVSPGSPGVPGCLVSTWGLSTIASRACCDLRPWFFTTRFLARGLSWLSWGPLVLSQHLGTVYGCSPGLLQFSPLVFLPLLSSVAVFRGSSGVPGCLASTWGLSTIAPRARCDRRRLFFYELLPCCGLCWLSWGLSMIAPRASCVLCGCFLFLLFSLMVSPGSPGVLGA